MPSPEKPSGAGPTIRDIARLTGLAVSTVCYALNDSKEVSVKTKQRVQAAAKQIGYTKNPLVSTLMEQVRRGKLPKYREHIAFLTAFATRDGWRSSRFVITQYEHAKKRANEYGYELQEYWLHEPGQSVARLARILINRGVRGVLIPPLPNAGHFPDFPWRHFFCVALGYSLLEPPLHRAVAHPFQAMQLSLTNLQQLGYRRPLFAITENIDAKTDNLFSIGWNFYHKQLFPDGKPLTLQCGRDQLRSEIIKSVRRHKPDVVIGFNPRIVEWLRAAQFRIPEELGVIDMNVSQRHSIAGINQHWGQIAENAVMLLITQLQSNSERGVPENPMLTTTYSSWINGATIRPQ